MVIDAGLLSIADKESRGGLMSVKNILKVAVEPKNHCDTVPNSLLAERSTDDG